MKFKSLIWLLSLIFVVPVLHAHTTNYEVRQTGIATRIFYSADDPASYSEFEIFAPGDPVPYQTGRTDRNGFIAFVPDRQGTWTVKVLGESAHGFHGVTVEIKVDKDLDLDSFKKPLAATYTRLVTGIGVILGIFGLYAILSCRKKERETG